MKMRVADYIAQLLVQKGMHNIFTVVGGGAMHLNDAFAHCEGLNVLYNHHEQACALAAEGYARVNGVPGVVCVTTGPGGTNAITGVLCAWQDNIPMLVISGQVRFETTVQSTGLNLRQYGEQEHYIIDTVRSITKYAEMVTDSQKIRYHVEKAIHIATQGRRGPCWLDIPLNIQGAIIEIEDQSPYIPDDEPEIAFSKSKVLRTLKNAKRPVILVGSAARIPEVHRLFVEFAQNLGIPVLAATSNADLCAMTDPFYYGNFGVFGGRTGNFIVQNADCLLVLGCRLSFKQIGFNYQQFAPNATKIVVDVDIAELQKKTTQIDIPICTELDRFLSVMLNEDISLCMDPDWIKYCNVLRERYPIYQERFGKSEGVNPYYLAQRLNHLLPDDAITVVGNSCACVCMLQMGVEKAGQRLWGNVNCGTMGYDLPAAIGAAVASKRSVVCATGDGSIQMNLQELQTVVSNGIPVKLIIFNNGGYHAIVQTQMNFFGRLSGCTKESGLSVPSFSRISSAYGIPYYKCTENERVDAVLKEFLDSKGYGLCEIFEDSDQPIEPKLKSKALPGGQMVSPPIDDLAPFLAEDEYVRFSNFGAGAWKE